MHDWEARAKHLDDENAVLRGRVRALEREIGLAVDPPLVFGLTKSEAIMFGVLLNNRAPRHSTFMTALFSDDHDDPSSPEIIKVWISKMRQKLKPHGIEIKTHRGVGFEMPEAGKAIARGLMGEPVAA
jgi:DNA-binding response OmpR family regulator